MNAVENAYLRRIVEILQVDTAPLLQFHLPHRTAFRDLLMKESQYADERVKAALAVSQSSVLTAKRLFSA